MGVFFGDSWVEWSTHELEVPLCTWTFPLDKIIPV